MAKKKGLVAKMAEINAAWWVGTAVLALGAGVWQGQDFLDDRYAHREALLIAGGKVDLLLDARLEALIEQRARLMEKKQKTADDLRQLDYLNKQIDYLRQVQRGQTK